MVSVTVLTIMHSEPNKRPVSLPLRSPTELILSFTLMKFSVFWTAQCSEITQNQ